MFLRAKDLMSDGYFNHAGCSVITERTKGAVLDQLGLEARVGSFAGEQAAAADLAGLYELAARALGASDSDIALTDSHTTGWAKALQVLNVGPGDLLLTTRSEWGGNFKSLRHLAMRVGAQVQVVESDDVGAVNLDKLRSLMSPRVKLISVTWLGSNGGHLEPVQSIGAVARSHGVPYFLDASQVVGQMPVDVGSIGCDVLTTPGRKWLRGPKGTGLMYLRGDFMAERQQSGAFEGLLAPGVAVTARHFEAPSTSCPIHMGLRSALQQFQEIGVENLQRLILGNTSRIREGLSSIPQVRFLNSHAHDHGLLSFTLKGRAAADVKAHLATKGIEVAANQAAYTPLDMQRHRLESVVRVSPHAHTTAEAIDTLVREVYALSRQT